MTKLLPDAEKIAVFRALQLGDMLCSVPAFRSLRKAYPNAEITLLGLPWAVSFVERFNQYFDRFIHFPGYPGLPEQQYDEKAYQSFVEDMHNESFDLIIQMQGNGTIVNEIVQELGANNLAGYFLPPQFKPSAYFMEYPNYGTEKSRHLALMEFLGIPAVDTQLEFPVTEKDEQDFQALQFQLAPGSYVCIHAGSRSTSRQWPPLYFGALADYCAQQNLTPVLTGTRNEVDISREVIKNIHHPYINLTGQTSMGAVAVLLSNAAMLISNSTGVAHIADALDTPSIVISMDGEPERWTPENKKIHSVTNWLEDRHFETVLQKTASLLENIKKRKPELI